MSTDDPARGLRRPGAAEDPASPQIPDPRGRPPLPSYGAAPPSPAAPPSAPRGAHTVDVSALRQLQAMDASPSWLASQQGGPAPQPASRPPPMAPPPQMQPMAPRPPSPSTIAYVAPEQGAAPPPMSALGAPPPMSALGSPPPGIPSLSAPLPGPPPRMPMARPVQPAPAPPAPPPAIREPARAQGFAEGPRPPAPVAMSALAASNAALQKEERKERVEPRPRVEPVAAPAPHNPPSEYVDLIWYDADALKRARANPVARPLFGPERRAVEVWLDSAQAAKTTQDQRDRADALRALTQGRALDDPGLTQAMIEAVSNEGAFTTPVAVIAGELSFRFDEIETLKAMTVVLAPLGIADKRLKDLCDAAGEVLRSSWQASGAGVAESMAARMREAFTQQNRTLPASYLDRTVDRALLEQRKYQRRTVLGGEMIRALLFAAGGANPVPAYLPQAMGAKLPLFPSFRAHVLANVLSQQDQSEPHAAALEVIALGRVMPLPSRGR